MQIELGIRPKSALLVFFAALLTAVSGHFSVCNAAPPGSNHASFGFAYSLQPIPKVAPPEMVLVVRAVAPGGPAHEAGVKVGDKVLAIDRRTVAYRDDADVLVGLASFKAGRKALFTILRDKKKMNIAVTPVAMTKDQTERWQSYVELALADRERAKTKNQHVR